MKDNIFRIIVLLALVLITGGCGNQETSRSKDTVACVGNTCLTDRDIQYQIPDSYRGIVTMEEKKEYVRRWLKSEILFQAAKNEKLDQDKRVQSLAQQAFKDLVVQQYLDARLKNKIEVTPEEALGFYRQNQSKFIWDDDYMRFSHIFTQGLAGISLADLLMNEGNKFEDVAARTSEDERTKKQGGDLGYMKLNELSPEVVEYAQKLKLNETSPPIKTSYGYEIIRLTDIKPKGSPQDFESVKTKIVNLLASDYRQREIDKMVQQLSDQERIETYDWAKDVKLNAAQ
jgi:parvulin-like peptidyl-prolyl isomerase